MAERPILFSAPMVRAILAGRKTQTRRLLKPFPTAQLPLDEEGFSLSALDEHGCGALVKDYGTGVSIIPLPRSPYGVRGDRMWVKEGWRPRIADGGGHIPDSADVMVKYLADATEVFFDEYKIPDTWNMPKAAVRGKAVTSLYMPRWAARLVLEVASVRVQRLHDITEEDARAEGVTFELQKELGNPGGRAHWESCREGFMALWDSLNAERAPWASNPWVWAISFRRTTTPEERNRRG